MCMMQVSEVAKDTITIRSLDHDRDRFDIEFGYALLIILKSRAVHMCLMHISFN